MSNIQITQGDFEKKLKLQFAPGIKAETPYFQLAEQFSLRPSSVATRQSSSKLDSALAAPSVPNQKIVVFSSNYELIRT